VRRKKTSHAYFGRAARVFFLSLVMLAFICYHDKAMALAQGGLYQALPFYGLAAADTGGNGSGAHGGGDGTASGTGYTETPSSLGPSGRAAGKASGQAAASGAARSPRQPQIIGVGDQVLQLSSEDSETSAAALQADAADSGKTPVDIDRLNDLNYMENAMYIVDEQTGFSPSLFDAAAFAAADLRIDNSGEGPKILIFHTHSQETFKDSEDPAEGIMGAGDLLTRILEQKYGINTLHYKGVFDMVNGQRQVMGAYEREEPSVKKLLADNPTIQLAIDMHRDGVNDNIHLVTDVNGKPMAQVMFFNGLCLINDNGSLNRISSLPNPYLKTNLALSFQLKLAADALYPGFSKKIYLNAWRYSLHMLPESTLVEVGANTNTKQEAYNAMEPLADVLARVILKN